MAKLLVDACSLSALNSIYQADCEFVPKKVKATFVSPLANLKIPTTENTLAYYKNLIATKQIYFLKGFTGAEGEVSDITVETTGYGNNKIGSLGGNANIKFDYPYSVCTFNQLQNWNGRKLYVYFVDEAMRLMGVKTLVDDVWYIKGQRSEFAVKKHLTLKFADGDTPKYITWLADDIEFNAFIQLDFSLNEIDGIIPVEIAVSDIQATQVTVTVTAGCNGTGVVGLDSLLENLNSGGTQTGTITEVGNGVYTITGLTTATDYSINLSSEVVEDDLGTLYGALETALSYTTI